MFSLCNLCVLCVSVVVFIRLLLTPETQRRQMLHREAVVASAPSYSPFKPTERGENRLKSRRLATYSMTFCAFTLLPASSNGGAKTAIAPSPGTTATIPPPTPLFAGRPTCQAQPPEPSYSPALIIAERMRGTFSGLITCSPV